MRDNDGINKAINHVRGLPQPRGITGRRSVVKYPKPSPADQVRDLLDLGENVTVIIINQPVVPPQEILTPLPPAPQVTPLSAKERKRAAALAKARLVLEQNREQKRKESKAEEERQKKIREQRIKNLEKARKKKGRK